MKNLFIILMVAVLCSFAQAGQTGVWQFSFTSDDLMNVTRADGIDGSTAVDNGIYDGARLYREGDMRSYHASTNDALDAWMASTEMRLADFNLWGYDGNGEKWGEEYKPKDPAWSNYGSSSSQWDAYVVDWPWGSYADYETSKQGAYTSGLKGELLGWSSNYANAIKFDGTSDTVTFTFDVNLNGSWYDDDLWYNGQEGQMVIWFGGSALASDGTWGNYYEGNMIIEGHRVPAPGAALLGGIGVACVGWIKRRRSL